MYGREKMWAERDWCRRLGYALLGELHIPGRLRSWHVIAELKKCGLWRPEPLTVCDAGGGEGAFAYYIARRFPSWRVVVADNEPDTLARAIQIKRRLGLSNLEVVERDLCQPGDEGVYDVVICADVLEHIEDDERAVKNMAYALRPGGVMIVTSPSSPQPRHLPVVAWRERRIGFSPEQYGHVRQGYGLEQLSQLFTNAGLEPAAVRYTFGRCGTLMFDLFFATGDSRPHPLVYALLLPVYMALARLDLLLPAAHGAAVLGMARKPRPAPRERIPAALHQFAQPAPAGAPTEDNPLQVVTAGPAASA